MRLTDLEPEFYKIIEPGKLWGRVDTLAEAQGIQFLCPKCFAENGGPVGTHVVACWFTNRGVSADEHPKPGRWNVSGTGFHDLSFTPPGAHSIQITGGCNWHGFLENGEIRTA